MRAVAVTLMLFGAGACHGPVDLQPAPAIDLDPLGRLVAANFDSVNGVPVQVASEVWCSEYWTQCETDPGSVPARSSVVGMVRAFSRELGIPLLEERVSEDLRCPWREANATGASHPRGLVASFLEPWVRGDSARVILRTACAGFIQAHEYEFRRTPDGEWHLVSRQLVFIT